MAASLPGPQQEKTFEVDTPVLWLCILCTALGLFFSINNYTLRHLTSSELEAILRQRQPAKSRRWAVVDIQELFLTTACMRFACIVGTVLCIVYMLVSKGLFAGSLKAQDDQLLLSPQALGWALLAILLISSPIVALFFVGLPVAWSRYGGQAALVKSLPILRIFYVLLWPVVRLLRSFERLVQFFHREKPDAAAKELEQDIMSAVDEGTREGLLGRDERSMIKRLIDFHDTQSSSIMTPRTEIVAVEVGASLKDIEELTATEGHSRIPVYEQSLDNIVGMLYAKDVLLHLANGGELFDVRKIMRPPIFVPQTKRIVDLLRELKAKKVHIAVVLDEYGGTSGLVSIEDILEEIVGEIEDEYEPPSPEPLVRLDEHTVEVDAKVRVEQLAEELNVQVSNDQDVDTVGGLVFSLLGYVPRKGQEVEHQRLRFTVLDAERRKIKRLKVEVQSTVNGTQNEGD